MDILPQELEVWYVLPALRKELAAAMKEKGLNQKEISKKLGISEPAVSQYFKKKRANEISFDKRIKERIKESAEKIIKGKKMLFEIDRLCRLIKKENILCDIHKKFCKIQKGCAICK